MTMSQLRNFITVCERLNYSQAADQLHLSRQALRKSISLLEEEGHTTLFHMEKNKLALTDAGKHLEEQARPLLLAFQKLEREYSQADIRQKQIHIAVDFSLYPFGIQLLSPLFQEFQQMYPDTRIYLEEKDCIVLHKDIKDKKYDFGILIDVPELMDYNVPVSFPLGDLMLFINQASLKKKAASVSIRFLDGKQMLLPGNVRTHSWIKELLRQCEDLKINTEHFEYDVPAEHMVYLVRTKKNAVGFGGESNSLLSPSHTATTLLNDFPYSPALCLFRARDYALNETEQQFIEFFRKSRWPRG